MNSLYILALQCCFAVVVRSAPVVPNVGSVVAKPEFKNAVDRAKALVEKLLRDIPAVHAATVHTQGLTLEPNSQPMNLQVMMTSLAFPSAPTLKQLSQDFTLELCVGRMSAGVRLHQDLLTALADRLTGLSGLRADLRDLLAQVHKMQEVGGLNDVEQYQAPDLASRLHGNYQVQVAGHLTLTQLRSFCQDLVRSLRHIASMA